MQFEIFKLKQKGFLIDGDILKRKSNGLYYKYEGSYYDYEFPVYCFRGNGSYFSVHTNCINKFFEVDYGGLIIYKEVK